jgi:predicted nicotinamide N-methyase
VTLTDRFDVLHLLRASVDANKDKLCNVAVQELSWGSSDLAAVDFDFLIASEVIYNGNLYEKLLATIRQLLEKNFDRNVPVIMSFERRSSEDRWMEMMQTTFVNVELHNVISVVNEKNISILKCDTLKN